MKIKRYFGEQIHQVMKQIKEDLGGDAVILSNKPIDGGYEVVCAVDYDEKLLATMPSSGNGSAQRDEDPFRPTTSRISTQNFNQTVTHAAGVAQSAARRSAPRAPMDNDTKAEPELRLQPDDVDGVAQANPVSELDQPHPAETTRRADIVWAQDPAIRSVREEISELRQLMESHVSAMMWGNLNQQNPARAKVIKKLLEMGFSVSLANSVVEQIPDDRRVQVAIKNAMVNIARRITIHRRNAIQQGGVIAVVGPTGGGKTTTIAKLAASYAITYGTHSVAMITTDNSRIGAQDQIRTYGHLFGLTTRTCRNGDELDASLRELQDKSLILIDTPGCGQFDSAIEQQIGLLSGLQEHSVETHLILPATMQEAAIHETVSQYEALKPAACIITKTDEATRLGTVVGAMIERHLPVSFVCHGQQIPDHIYFADKLRLTNQILEMFNKAISPEMSNEAFAVVFEKVVNHANH